MLSSQWLLIACMGLCSISGLEVFLDWMVLVDMVKMADDLDRSVEQSMVQLNLYFSNVHSIRKPSTLGLS
jgi:hypothetical protein